VMTWIVFDPSGDLNDLEGSDLADYSHELRLRDAVALIFDQQSDVVPGAEFDHNIEGTSETRAGMRAVVHLAPERLTQTSTYGDLVPLASRRLAKVVIQEADFVNRAPIRGELTFNFERAETDPATVRAGTFSGSFTAPFVNERAAEQNLALLDTFDVLGVPLAPKEQP
jgi:hypothetical protein